MDEVKKFDISNRLYALILIFVAVVVGYLAINMGFYAFSVIPNSYTKTIVVSGEGKAYAKPDVAIITLGVKTEAPKSDDAVNQNNVKMNAIIAAVKALSIDEKDIQTTAYNLYPVYDYTEQSGRKLTGYSLDQQVTIKVRSFDKISSVLDAGTKNGANNVGNLQIIVDNPEKVKAEARDNAIIAAKQKATEMAKSSGLKLGKVIDIQENNYYAPTPIAYGAGKMMENSLAVPTADIQAGQDEFSITVSLTYQVK